MILKKSTLTFATKGKNTLSLALLTAAVLGGIWLYSQSRHSYISIVTAPDTDGGDWFGSALAVSEPWVAVTAFRASGPAKQTGAAYLYRRDAESGWAYRHTISASDAQPLDQFGFSVDLEGDTLVVGSVSTFAVEPLNRSDGRVYVYRFNEMDWLEEAILEAPDALKAARFGYSVALSGDWLLIGAKSAGDEQRVAGAAYLYRYENEQWLFKQKLEPDSLQDGDEFGTAVDLDVELGVLVVGAPMTDNNGMENSGSIFIYQLQEQNWVLSGQLSGLENLPANHQLGVGVTLSGERKSLLAGASSWKREPRTGAAYIFELATEADLSIPISVTPLVPANLNSGDMFGFRVAWAGDRAVVGAHLADGDEDDTGAVFSFSYSENQWLPDTAIVAVDQHANDHFGIALAGHDSEEFGKQVIVGAESADVTGKDSGGIYFHKLP